MKVVLDTNICIYALKGNAQVLKHLLSCEPSRVYVSVISEGELRLGAAKSQTPEKTLRRVLAFLRPLTLLPFESDDTAVYAHVRARLEKAGKPIGPLDTLIGAHAMARDLTLITNNGREFARIKGLRIENWTRPLAEKKFGASRPYGTSSRPVRFTSRGATRAWLGQQRGEAAKDNALAIERHVDGSHALVGAHVLRCGIAHRFGRILDPSEHDDFVRRPTCGCTN